MTGGACQGKNKDKVIRLGLGRGREGDKGRKMPVPLSPRLGRFLQGRFRGVDLEGFE